MNPSTTKFLVLLLLGAMLASTQAGEVVIYTGQVGWITKADADIQAQICVNKLTAWGITNKWYFDALTVAADKAAIATWMTAKTGNGEPDVLILYGVFPETIYPPPNVQIDGSIAELFIESTDGDMIINHGDAMFYVTGAGTNNGYAGLQNMMDNAAITQAFDNTPMNITAAGKAIASSLGPLWSDRMFVPSQFTGQWYVEAALGRNHDGTRVEPVIVRDGPRGRLMMLFQTNGEGWNPKGAVAAEVCSWIFGVNRGAPTAVGVRAVKAAKAAILAFPPATGVTNTTPVAWAGDAVEITVDLLEATGSSTFSATDVTVDLTTDSATGRFDTAADGSFSASSISVTIPAGSPYVDVYYKDAVTCTPTLTASSASLASGSRLMKIFARTYAPGGEVAFYTAGVSWVGAATANTQAQIAANKLSILGVTSGIYSAIDDPVLLDEADLAAWMTAKTGNGRLDVLMIFGFVPPTIYAYNNTQPDGSIAELFIESTDGDVIISSGDAFWYVTRTTNNGYNGLRYLTDMRDFLQSAGTITSVVTPLGQLLTPSLNNFTSDRPFCIDMLLNNWLVEAAAAGGISGGRAAADPVCIRDGDRGRVIPLLQRSDDNLPRGAVAAEIIASLYGYMPAVPVQFALVGRTVGGVEEPLKFTAQVQGLIGSPAKATADTTVSLTADSATGAFDIALDGAFDGSVTSLLIPAGSSSAVFYYKDTAGGLRALTASATGFTAATINVNVFPRTLSAAGEVAVYTGMTWWIDKTLADGQADVLAARLAPAGIPVTLYKAEADQAALATWVTDRTNNGKQDVLVLYGCLPRSIYPTSTALTDGTLAELFIESADGDAIVNSGDWMFYCDYDALGVRYENGAAALQSMMDTPGIGMGADDTPVLLTADGKAITPSMRSFLTDRPFFPDQFGGEWYVEAALARNTDGTRIEPAIVRDGARGRLIALFQTNAMDVNTAPEPKGAVGAEIVAYLMGVELVPAKLGLSNDGGAAVAFARDPVKLTVKLLDAAGVPAPAAADVTANLASSAPGAFDIAADGNFDGSVTSATIPAGALSATFYFRARAAGTVTVSASDAGAALGGADLAVAVHESPVLEQGTVVIYTGNVGWISKVAADEQAQICVNALTAAGITNTWYPSDLDKDAVATWVASSTNNGKVDVLVLYGYLPEQIYPPGNTMLDGTVVELFIESPDGDTIVNHADYFFYVTTPCCNGDFALPTIMDLPAYPLWGDNTPMYATADGMAIAPSLRNFWSDRAFRIDQLAGEWFVEAALALDAFGTRTDPVVVRDGARGRLVPAFQAADQNDPKGAVAAEVIAWLMDGIIVDTAPVAAISAAPVAGKAPLEVTFSAAGSTYDGAAATYTWNFGDGASAAGMDVVHTYTDVGTYTATVTVADDMGDTDTASVAITADLAPIAVISAAPLIGRAPLEVTFSAAGSSDDGTIAGYEWDFGDGETAEGADVVHTYAAEGEYTATLTVTDNFGSTGAASVAITVEPAGTRFKRGDSNADAKVDIADAICTLGYLFGMPSDPCKGKIPDCFDAADANDDGKVDIADAVKVLGHLFAQTGPLPDPFAECGLDPTVESPEQTCVTFAPCP